jgi:hypothetical protein
MNDDMEQDLLAARALVRAHDPGNQVHLCSEPDGTWRCSVVWIGANNSGVLNTASGERPRQALYNCIDVWSRANNERPEYFDPALHISAPGWFGFDPLTPAPTRGGRVYDTSTDSTASNESSDDGSTSGT